MNEQELKKALQEQTFELYKTANKMYDRIFTLPEVSFKLTGMCAGMFCCKSNRLTNEIKKAVIKYNLEFSMVNQAEAFDTVIHEVAHHINRILHGRYVQSHGASWWRVYRDLGGKQNKHTYSKDCVMPASYYRKRPFIYSCKCQTFDMTTRMHNSMQGGSIRICNACRGPLVFKSASSLALPERMAAKTISKESTSSLQELLMPRSKTAPFQSSEVTLERLAAKEKGYIWYWTGRPCKHGHVSSRNASNGICRECWNTLKHDKTLMDKEL